MFAGVKGNTGGTILIVGDCFTNEDDRYNVAFSGQGGREIAKTLTESGIPIEDCLFTTLCNKYPSQGRMVNFFIPQIEAKAMKMQSYRGLYPDVALLQGLETLSELIHWMQPKLIIALGNYPLWALSEDSFSIINGSEDTKGFKVPTGITVYRGSQLRCRFGNYPLLPIYAPAMANKNWPWRYLNVHDLNSRGRKALIKNMVWDEPERNFIINPSFDEAMEVLHTLELRATLSPNPILLSVDIETLGKFIECISISHSKTDAICIPFICQRDIQGYWNTHEEVAIILQLKKLLEHPNVDIGGQNFSYDYQYLWYYYNIQCTYKQDSMLAHHVCFPGTPMDLGYLSSLYCFFHKNWKEDGKAATTEKDDHKRWLYNCRDTAITYELIEELWIVLAYYKQQTQYAIQMVRTLSAIKMMMRGIVIDSKRRGQEQIIHIEAAQLIENSLEYMVPESVLPRDPKKTSWYRSPLQLADFFYEILGIAPVVQKKTGGQTVDDEALKKIALREPILTFLVETLQQYRSLEAYGQFINMKVGPDGRMRTSFSPTTETFRYRSSADIFGFGRNLQNLPKGNEED